MSVYIQCVAAQLLGINLQSFAWFQLIPCPEVQSPWPDWWWYPICCYALRCFVCLHTSFLFATAVLKIFSPNIWWTPCCSVVFCLVLYLCLDNGVLRNMQGSTLRHVHKSGGMFSLIVDSSKQWVATACGQCRVRCRPQLPLISCSPTPDRLCRWYSVLLLWVNQSCA